MLMKNATATYSGRMLIVRRLIASCSGPAGSSSETLSSRRMHGTSGKRELSCWRQRKTAQSPKPIQNGPDRRRAGPPRSSPRVRSVTNV